MQLTKDQIESFKAASLPLMRWMRENCHPHVACIINSEGSELLEGMASAVRSLAEAEIAMKANNEVCREAACSPEADQPLAPCRACWNCHAAVELPPRGYVEQCPHCGAFGPHGEPPENTPVRHDGAQPRSCL